MPLHPNDERDECPERKNGLFDWLDVKLGRFSDSDTMTGNRRRSFGVTLLFWFSMPMIGLITYTGISLLIIAFASKTKVPESLAETYKICLQVSDKITDKDAKLKAMLTCKPPASVVSSIQPKLLDIGAYPWAGAGLLVIIGALIMIMRRKQDYERFQMMAEKLSVFVTNGKTVPPDIWNAFKASAIKAVGSDADGVIPPPPPEVASPPSPPVAIITPTPEPITPVPRQTREGGRKSKNDEKKQKSKPG